MADTDRGPLSSCSSISVSANRGTSYWPTSNLWQGRIWVLVLLTELLGPPLISWEMEGVTIAQHRVGAGCNSFLVG
jgi:hypothetical protein